MPSIIEVAKSAGVSTGTVSNVLNNRPVTPETRELVQRVMAEMKYEPRRIRSGRSRVAELKSVSLLILGASIKSVLRHPVYFNMIHGVERACDAHGLPLKLRALPESDDRQRLSVQKGEGLILFRDQADDLPLDELRGVPAVKALNSPLPGFDHVTYNDGAVGRIAAEWLVGRGASNVGVISHVGWARTTELTRVLEQRGCTVHAIDASRYTQSSSANSALDSAIDDELLRQDLDSKLRSGRPIDGLFLYSDELAAHTYPFLYSMGVRPQRDLHVISCNNDQPYLTPLRPRPATIDIHIDDVGQEAVDLLLARAARSDDPVKSLQLEPTIVDESIPAL